MAEFKGDATQEDVDKQVLKDLRARLASSSSTVPVTLTQAQAARLYEMAGGTMEAEEEEAQDRTKMARVSAPGQYPEPMPMVSQQSPEQKAGVASEPKAGEQQQAHTGQQAAQPNQQQAGQKKTRAQLNDMTKEELIEYADDNDIDVTPSWSKADIVDAIAKHR